MQVKLNHATQSFWDNEDQSLWSKHLDFPCNIILKHLSVKTFWIIAEERHNTTEKRLTSCNPHRTKNARAQTINDDIG